VTEGPGGHVNARGTSLAAFAAAGALAVLFVFLTLPLLGVLAHDFDEAWLMLDARFIARGERPFADFAHHEPPLHLYLLTLSGKVFGQTVFGYRMLSLVSIAASGFLLFCLVRPFGGAIPALIAETIFLFSPLHTRGLSAVPETPMVACTLLATLLLFVGRRRWTGYAGGVAFVGALLIKPTCLPMVVAAAASLAWARDWRRLRDFAVAGVLGGVAGLTWMLLVSDGAFADILRFQVSRIGTRSISMWSIDTGFADIRRLAGIETPRQWAVRSFLEFFHWPAEYAPMALFAAALLAVPVWIARLGDPALRAFVVLWPASWLWADFVGLDFVSPRYFQPFAAFGAFLLAGWPWLAQRWIPAAAVAAAGGVAGLVLAADLRPALAENVDPWYWGRLHWIAREAPTVVSFSPMLFAATGTEPGCGLANAALTWGGFGEAWPQTDRTRGFRFSDERVIACLRARPDVPIVIDWAFYFFTRPGSPLRRYLAAEGSGQRLFFSPEALQQWERPLLQMSPLR
jgi:4-amino-4-deoxy-L-arabinose transferase-like glycosyltransferase